MSVNDRATAVLGEMVKRADLQGFVSNPGLPMTSSAHYSEHVIMYTATWPVACVVDGAPPGKNGRLFTVPVGKPTKVPFLAGKFMLDHYGYTGIVQVMEYEQHDEEGNVIGVTYDVETAHKESLEKGREQDEIRFMQWVTDMTTDYINRADGKQKVPPPPPEPIRLIIERRNYKMQDYGIKPIGYRDPIDEMNEARDRENAHLKAQVADLNSKLNLLLQQAGVKTDGDTDGDTGVQNMPAANRPGRGGKPRSGR